LVLTYRVTYLWSIRVAPNPRLYSSGKSLFKNNLLGMGFNIA